MKINKLNIIKRKAFSLYEFLIVFFIIGLIAAMTLPTVRNYSPSWKISTNSKIILNKLRLAQEESVTTQNQHAIRFDTAANPLTFQLINLSGGEVVSETIKLDSGVTLAIDASFTDNQVIFSADGGPSSSGNIVVTYLGRTKTINISPAGVMKIQ